jgi:hypothetical protein
VFVGEDDGTGSIGEKRLLTPEAWIEGGPERRVQTKDCCSVDALDSRVLPAGEDGPEDVRSRVRTSREEVHIRISSQVLHTVISD